MYFLVEENLEEFKNVLIEKRYDDRHCINFLDVDDLEDEFTHNEIDIMQTEFKNEVVHYLKDYYPNQFGVWVDYTVHLATVNFLKTNSLEKYLIK